MSSQGIFAVGRARVRNRGRKDPIRSASSLAAAARRPGPARRSRTNAETTMVATPTLTSLTIPNSSMSRRRLAGTGTEPVAAESGPAHATPESGLRAVDPMDIWLQAVSGPLGRSEPLSRGSGVGGRHAAPAIAARPAPPASPASADAGVGRAPVDNAGAPAGNEARGRRPGGADPGSRSPSAHPAPGRRSGRRSSTTAQVGHQVTTELSRAETAAIANQEIFDIRTLDVEHVGTREEVHPKADPRLDPARGRRGHPPRLGLGGLAHLPGVRPPASRFAERHRTAGRTAGHHDIGPHGHRRNRRRPAGRGVLGQVGGR